jgi:glycosyltransferase involved in cell wall biosynthesis
MCGRLADRENPEVIVTVIVMAFDEVNTLEAVVGEIDRATRELEMPYELVVIDDGSSDGTAVIADRLSRQLPRVRVIHHEVNRGLGEVYRTGFAAALGRFVTFFPADGQFPPAIINRFLLQIEEADIVLGYLPNRHSSLLAKSLSLAERVLYRLLFGPLPRFQGVIMFKRKLLDELELRSTGRGWTVLMELIVRASREGYRLVSVPTAVRPRMSGKSKVNNLRTIWANLKQVVALRRHL